MAKRTEKSPQKPQLTVVIGTLNRPGTVIKLLRQLVGESTRLSLEVVVVDQSERKEYETLSREFPIKSNFNLVHFDKPNTCKYLNYGWRNGNAPVVLYLDDDTEITNKTLQAHLDRYKNPGIMGVAGRVLNDGEKTSTETHVGKTGFFGATFDMNFSSVSVTMADFPYGCNMSFRRNALEKVGGFDEELRAPIFSYSEVDLGIRVNKIWPGSIIFVPDALVYHHKSPRGGTRNNFTKEDVIKCNNFNYGYFIGKNYGWIENGIFWMRALPHMLFKNRDGFKYFIEGFNYAKNNRRNTG